MGTPPGLAEGRPQKGGSGLPAGLRVPHLCPGHAPVRFWAAHCNETDDQSHGLPPAPWNPGEVAVLGQQSLGRARGTGRKRGAQLGPSASPS